MFRLIKMIKDKGRWRIFKLKLIDARLYFVSIFVGLLTGLVAVPYHYLLQFFFNLRKLSAKDAGAVVGGWNNRKCRVWICVWCIHADI